MLESPCCVLYGACHLDVVVGLTPKTKRHVTDLLISGVVRCGVGVGCATAARRLSSGGEDSHGQD